MLNWIVSIPLCNVTNFINYFRCYTVHIVELLNCYTNYCTYIKFTIKTLKTLRHVLVLGPSSGSHIVLAKVTIQSHINFAVPVGYCGSMPDDGPRTETCRSVLMCKNFINFIYVQ